MLAPIRLLEEAGVIRGRVALLDRRKLNVGVTVFVAVRTNQHNQEWLERFSRAVDSIPEVVEFYRMAGDIDYLLRWWCRTSPPMTASTSA